MQNSTEIEKIKHHKSKRLNSSFTVQTQALEAANKSLTEQVTSLTRRVGELETTNTSLQNELTKFTG